MITKDTAPAQTKLSPTVKTTQRSKDEENNSSGEDEDSEARIEDHAHWRVLRASDAYWNAETLQQNSPPS
jgi:hypothetical protein